MEWINVILTVLAGVFLRIALPVLITLLLVLWLRWLDVRWQREGERYGSARAAMTYPRCWAILGCPPERRDKCPAYHNRDAPCWQTFRKSNGELKGNCLLCKVFREAPLPVAV